ncbi:MAG: 2-succinyl-5-enolpyruvyl-6-hydroxy-3-cyclohexene-1-carboxylic-acid synthase [Marinilabiliaceae bacterium]|nr:2-succinyl-5-enolpyruvyl-6-hydroxy-3-cyclohexene-1-carboxylic-acid synthase [Marinilabiliaceae bacterium]
MSKPISDKKTVRILIDLCRAEGISDIIISPGSRNAPLTLSFAALDDFNCYSVVDERSAAFFALGIAQQKRKIVALLCTSGTAVLNYAPAIAEAFYQNIPLVIITADRPSEWLGQGDGQTINQDGIFSNYIKYSCTLPVEINSQEDKWFAERMVSEAFIKCMSPLRGPVHINVPFREPLYGKTVQQISKSRPVVYNKSVGRLPDEVLVDLAEAWSSTERIMVLVGMRNPDLRFQLMLNELEDRERIIILTESLSNCNGDGFINCIDRVVATFRDEEVALFKPDLLITFDGQIVSKKIKQFLRDNKPKEHWHISESGAYTDTYMQLTRVLHGDPVIILEQLIKLVKPIKSRYRENWKKRYDYATLIHDEYTKQLPWSDFKVFQMVIKALPRPCVLQLGNSTPVRYAQLFNGYEQVESYSNRGTSGIDGCVSTAVGASVAREEPVVLVTGDLSFFYDSNALWNKYISKKFKIIVVNNGGGGIFRFIPGPAETEELEEFFATGHSMNADNLAAHFKICYNKCSTAEQLDELLPSFFEQKESAILEVLTPIKNNAKVLKDYFCALKK